MSLRRNFLKVRENSVNIITTLILKVFWKKVSLFLLEVKKVFEFTKHSQSIQYLLIKKLYKKSQKK